MVMAVVGLQLLDGHTEPASGLPHVYTGLHQPRRRCVAQRMPDDIFAKPGVLQNAFPSRTDFAGKRLPIVHAVDDEADLLAALQNAGRAQLA